MFSWLKTRRVEGTLTDHLIENWIGVDTKTSRKNMECMAAHFKFVASNLRSVSVSKTSDTTCDTITFIGSNGTKATIWLWPETVPNV